MHTDFEKIRQIFLAIVEQPPSRWDTLLDEACATDPGLRSQVALLLRAHAKGEGILDRHPVDKTPTGCYESAGESPGAALGPYKLLEPIGEGGMGTVWKAEQEQPLRRLVALKVLKAGMDSAQVLARFEAERQALALMDHPNIARVFDAGTTETGRPYFVMELVNGAPITRYCDDHGLPLKERLGLFVQVCQAVQHAHQKGIIHRDIKPSNVLVGSSGGRPVVKVIDFGVAKAMGQRLTEKTLFTGVGAVVGTLEYMSPEQAELGNHDIDTRSDIYSLGVLLYELLTGSTPLDRSRLQQVPFTEILRLIREEEAPRPSSRLDDPHSAREVRGELDWIVMKCLEKDRSRRYETANALARDIERHLCDEAVEACPPSPAYLVRKFLRKHRTAVLFTAGLVGALLVVVAGLTAAYFQVVAAKEAAEAAGGREKEANEKQRVAREEAEKSAREKGWMLMTTQLANATRLMEKGDLFGALLWNVEALKTGQGTPAEEVQRLRIAALLDHCPKLLRVSPGGRWWSDGSRLFIPAVPTRKFDKNGEPILPAGPTARVLDVLSGEPASPPLPEFGDVYRAVFSPDGQRLLTAATLPRKRLDSNGKYLGEDTVTQDPRVWDVKSGKAVTLGLKVKDKGPLRVSSVAFRPDGTRVVTLSRQGELETAVQSLRMWDALTGEPIALPVTPAGRMAHVGFTTGGRLKVIYEQPGPPRSSHLPPQLWDLTTGQPVMVSLPLEKNERLVDFSPDGRYAITDTRVWDLARGVALTPILRGRGLRVHFSPRGDLALFVIDSDGDGEVWVWNLASGEQIGRAIRPGARVVGSVGFAPDGRRIFTTFPGTAQGSSGIRLWDAFTQEPLSPILSHPHEEVMPVFSADGNFLVARGANQTRVWDVRKGPAFLPLGQHDRIVDGDFSPDGRRVVTASDGTARVWDVQTRTPVTPPLVHPPSWMKCVFFSPDGRRVLTLSWPLSQTPQPPQPGRGPECEVRIWDAGTGQLLAGPLPHLCNPLASHGSLRPRDLPSFSPDGAWVLTRGNDGLRVWDAGTGQPLTPAFKDGERGWFLPGGRLLFASSQFSGPPIKCWDLAAGEFVDLPLKRGAPFWDVRPDGRTALRAVVPSNRRTGQVWDMVKDAPATPPLVHLHADGPVRQLTDDAMFSPDGTRVLTVGGSAAQVWDAATGSPVGQPIPATVSSQAPLPAFSPDGRLILAVNPAGAQVWEAATGFPVTPPLPLLQDPYQALAISRDGRHILHSGINGLHMRAWMWEVVPDRRSADDLAHLAEFLSGLRMDVTGVVRGTRTGEEDWKTLSAKFPDSFHQTPAEETAWHWQEVLAPRDSNQTAYPGHLEALLVTEPGDWSLHARRGDLHNGQGKGTEAVADYLRATELAGDPPPANLANNLDQLGRKLWSENQPQEAERALHAAASIFEKELVGLTANSPKLASVRGQLAWTHFFHALALAGSARSAEAIRAYRRSIELDTARPSPWPRIGLTRALCTAADPKLREPKEALALAREAVKLMGDKAPPDQQAHAQSTLGIALYRSGDWQAATEAMEKAVELRKNNDVVDWFFLAMAYRQRGDRGKAREWYDRAVSWVEQGEPLVRQSGPIGGAMASAQAGPFPLLAALQLQRAAAIGENKAGDEERRVARLEAAALLSGPADGEKP